MEVGSRKKRRLRQDSSERRMTMVEENVLIQEQADPSDTDTHLIIEAKRGNSKLTIGCDKL